MSEKSLVDIRLLNKEFAVLCPEEEKAALFAAAAHLDKKMRDIRNSSKAIGMERIAIIAALNLAHDLLAARQKPPVMAGPRAVESSRVAKVEEVHS